MTTLASEETDYRYRVYEPGYFNAQDLKKVFSGEYLAIVQHDALSPEICDAIAAAAKADPRRAPYEGVEHVGHVVNSLFELGSTPERLKEYFKQAKETFDLNRAMTAPYMNPIDFLRLKAAETWGAPVDLLRIGGQTGIAGLIRFLKNTAAILPHNDVIAWDCPDALEAHRVIAQVAVNYHVETAEEGGELELWDYRPSFAEHQARLRRDGMYGLDRALMPEPVMTIRPRKGDLIIFDSTRVHAVTEVKGKATRVTVSVFIGLTRDGRLVFWS